MRYLSKALLANGLALAVGPFCFLPTVNAQDYIDVEAERAAAAANPSSSSSSAVQPAQAYPVTSYGIGSAPAAPVLEAESPATPVAGGSNAGQLLLKVQQLQQEVMRLNGMVEEQAHELRTLKAQSLERYIDLDRRLGMLAGGTGDPLPGAEAPLPAASAPVAEAAVEQPLAAAAAPAATGAAEQPGEGPAYQAAYALVRSQQFNKAVTAFQQFLQDYPSGRFAPNAHYWLGELHLVTSPPDTEAARQSFMLLLDLYPKDSKVPDALFKLGRIHYTKGNRERAREFLDRVISEFGATNSAAVKLAQDFISENY
ncbi:MAG: tol-pal system protein YbgF [Haliea sp.]|uniref:tol-pal system protein YbgF n=1 Tax=Haliea sp. TaxID=1932666 RepID=UPI0032EC68FD